ncbi:MAG TPA: trigger factor [Spirochaetota bacterium]|nr:trigger factor [Spirochaetota bacterium]
MQLTSNYEKIPQCKYKISVEIPYTELQNEYNKVKHEIKNDISIPGFRKGKVPDTILEKRYKPSLQAKVIENILPRAYKQILEDKSLKTFGQPEAKNISEYKEGAPLKAEFTVDRMPSCTINNSKRFAVNKDYYIVEEQDLETEIKRTIRRKADIKNYEGPAKEGDILKIDIKVENDDLKDTSLSDYSLELNNNSHVPFDLFDELKGIKTGQTKKVSKNYNKKYKDQRLAGKKVNFSITAKEIKAVTYPDLTDELARELQYKDIADMRSKIKSQLQALARQRTDDLLKKKILEELRKETNFEIPQSIIDYTTQQYIQQFKMQFGNNEQLAENFLKNAKQNGRDIYKEYKEMALYNIENDLITEKIIKDNNIEVPEEKIREEINQIAVRSGQEPKQLKKEMLKSGGYTNLKNKLLDKEAINFIASQNKLKEGKKINIITAT